MKLKYQAQIIDEETNNVVSVISSYSQEGLEEEMGKRKWREAVKCQLCGSLKGELIDGRGLEGYAHAECIEKYSELE